METKMLHVEDAARSLGVSKKQIYRMVENRVIKHYRVGQTAKSRICFSEDHISDYLRAREVEPVE